MLVTISTTTKATKHAQKIWKQTRAKKVSKTPKEKNIDNQKTKKANNNNNNGRFFFSIFLKGVEPTTGWALLLAWLARPAGRFVSLARSLGWLLRAAAAELFLLQWQQRKRTQWRWTWRKEKHKTRVPRYSLTHTHTHTLVSSLPRHYQGTTSLPFNLVGTKTNLTCLWPSTLVNDFYFYFVVNFAILPKIFGRKNFSVANSLFFPQKKRRIIFPQEKPNIGKHCPQLLAINMERCLRFSTWNIAKFG